MRAREKERDTQREREIENKSVEFLKSRANRV